MVTYICFCLGYKKDFGHGSKRTASIFGGKVKLPLLSSRMLYIKRFECYISRAPLGCQVTRVVMWHSMIHDARLIALTI